MWLTRRRACGFAAAVTAAATATINAATINVPLDQPTVQAGIDAATDDEDLCGYGGAIDGADLVMNCILTGNSSASCGYGDGGGGIFYANAVINCVLVANTCWDGAGIYDAGVVINSTFVGNGWAGSDGGGIKFADAIINCIFRGNTADQIYDCPNVTYSNVEGGWPGMGNIDADPLFDADYHLTPGSPSIDAGHNWAIAGQADTDLAGQPRFADDPATADTGCGVPVVVDMGAYEYQGDPFPVRLGDLDGDGTVGVVDFLSLLADWGPCAEPCCLADLDLDGTVGVNDFLALLAGWG
jgi:hypothetical protein